MSPAQESPPANTVTLIDELLAEQRSLTAVERFARKHEAHSLPVQARFYRDLIPLTRPQPGEQFAFEVDLDQCTGCKGCVTACHSLNGLDDGESWRNVGLLVGGINGHAMQQTVTTTCHHCVDPGCLNGCPVLAYDKDPVTGIVRHLDDQCIGCQYCVMKCPYDVPKYSARLGIVRKCDLCHQRLAVGEAPACVQACPNEAIKITVVEQRVVAAKYRERSAADRPATHNRSAAVSAGPAAASGVKENHFLAGSPEPDYTLPTTTYRTNRPVMSLLKAADESALRIQPAHWPLVFLLVLSQASVGLALAAWLVMWSPKTGSIASFPLTPALSPEEREYDRHRSEQIPTADKSKNAELASSSRSLPPLLGGEGRGEGEGSSLESTSEPMSSAGYPTAVVESEPPAVGSYQFVWTPAARLLLGATVFMALALGIASLHLGRPQKAWRAFLGWRTSWFSREAIAFGGYLGAIVVAAVAVALGFGGQPFQLTLATAAALLGLVSVFCSLMLYVDTRREFWSASRTGVRFFGSTALLGLSGWIAAAAFAKVDQRSALLALISISLLKLVLELTLLRHGHKREWTPLKRTARLMVGPLRFALFTRVALGTAAGLALPLSALLGLITLSFATALILVALLLTGELAERYLYFTAVSPRQMPGGLTT